MIYLKINDTLYPASFYGRNRDTDWNNRESMAITVSMPYEQAAETFVNGLRWEHVSQTGEEAVVTDYSEFEVAGPITDNRDGTVTCKMGKLLDSEALAIILGEV